jgi:hypothetical protein
MGVELFEVIGSNVEMLTGSPISWSLETEDDAEVATKKRSSIRIIISK